MSPTVTMGDPFLRLSDTDGTVVNESTTCTRRRSEKRARPAGVGWTATIAGAALGPTEILQAPNTLQQLAFMRFQLCEYRPGYEVTL
jgi:hypothetical protein